MREILRKENLFGVNITNASSNEVLEYITTRLKLKDEKVRIFTPNPEIIVASHHDPRLESMLNRAQIALADGVGLSWAANFLGYPLKERITGVDFMETLCEKLSKQTETIGLLGAREGVAEATAKCLREKYPGLHIVYVGEEWDDLKIKDLPARKQDPRLKNKDQRPMSVDYIDVLFVAFGFPKQEKWITENLDRIPVTVAMGVGGAFDYISGNVGRAPLLVRRIGFEWLWRLVRQPWRWKRQRALVKFVGLVIKEKFQYKGSRKDTRQRVE